MTGGDGEGAMQLVGALRIQRMTKPSDCASRPFLLAGRSCHSLYTLYTVLILTLNCAVQCGVGG